MTWIVNGKCMISGLVAILPVAVAGFKRVNLKLKPKSILWIFAYKTNNWNYNIY